MAMDYEEQLAQRMRSLGYPEQQVQAMTGPDWAARRRAQEAQQEAHARQQEARQLALEHLAKEQASAGPGAAQDYQDGFAEAARRMGYDESSIKAMVALPGGSRVSEARVRDLTARYSEALRVQEAGGAGGGGDRPFEPAGDDDWVPPRIEDDPSWSVSLGISQQADRIAEAKGEPATEVARTMHLWGLWVENQRLQHSVQRMRETAVAALGDSYIGDSERVQEAVALQATDASDGAEKAWEVILQQAGDTKFGNRRYPEATLKDAVGRGLYDGAKVYFNHASPQDIQRGYRNVREWAATVRPGSVRFDEATGSVIGVAVVHDATAAALLESPTARAHVGLSTDLTAKWAKGAGGRQEATRFSQVHSVDLVPEGNAVHTRAVIGPAQ